MKNWFYVIYLLFPYLIVIDGKFFKFEDCSKEDGISKDVKLEISPDPVKLDQYIFVNMTGSFLADIPPEAVLKIQHYKLKSFLGVSVHIPIPCIDKHGSCTLPLCEVLDLYKDTVRLFFPPGRDYGCPVKAGEYGAQNVEIENPDVSSTARFLLSGKYQTELRLLDNNSGKELACFKVFTQLK